MSVVHVRFVADDGRPLRVLTYEADTELPVGTRVIVTTDNVRSTGWVGIVASPGRGGGPMAPYARVEPTDRPLFNDYHSANTTETLAATWNDVLAREMDVLREQLYAGRPVLDFGEWGGRDYIGETARVPLRNRRRLTRRLRRRRAARL
jgi:hypothetical protein